MASVRGLEGWFKKGSYSITDGSHTISKYVVDGVTVYRISCGGKFVGGVYESAKKSLQSLNHHG